MFPHLVCCMPVQYFEWFIRGRSCLRPSNSVCVCLYPHQNNPKSTTHTPSREVCHPIVGRVFPLHSLSLFLPCLPIWVVLQCLYMYMVAFLVLRVLYVVALVYFALVSWFFPPKFLPGDDVLCRLLLRPLTSVCFLPCLFVFFCFVFPTVFVPDLFWCNFLYLVTTGGFVADQLIM